jgi:hypothetical protein
MLSLPGAMADAVALRVEGTDGRNQIIFSAISEGQTLRAGGAVLNVTFGVVDDADSSESLFLGNGTRLSSGNLRIELSGSGSAFVRREGDHLSIKFTRSGQLTIPAAGHPVVLRIGGNSIAARSIHRDGQSVPVFSLPAMALSNAQLLRP